MIANRTFVSLGISSGASRNDCGNIVNSLFKSWSVELAKPFVDANSGIPLFLRYSVSYWTNRHNVCDTKLDLLALYYGMVFNKIKKCKLPIFGSKFSSPYCAPFRVVPLVCTQVSAERILKFLQNSFMRVADSNSKSEAKSELGWVTLPHSATNVTNRHHSFAIEKSCYIFG